MGRSQCRVVSSLSGRLESFWLHIEFARGHHNARKDGPELNADVHAESLNPFAVFSIEITYPGSSHAC
jgi:hypothetical protein